MVSIYLIETVKLTPRVASFSELSCLWRVHSLDDFGKLIALATHGKLEALEI